MNLEQSKEKRKLFSKAVEENDFELAARIFIEFHEEFDFDLQLTKMDSEKWQTPLMLIGLVIDQNEELYNRLLQVWENPSPTDMNFLVTLSERLALKFYEGLAPEVFKYVRLRVMEVFGCEEETPKAIFEQFLKIYIEAKTGIRQS